MHASQAAFNAGPALIHTVASDQASEGQPTLTVRTSSKSVTFLRPFILSGVDEEQPAGTYIVETDEELIPFLSFSAYRRIATWFKLAEGPGGKGMVETVQVDPIELETLQARDAKSGDK